MTTEYYEVQHGANKGTLLNLDSISALIQREDKNIIDVHTSAAIIQLSYPDIHSRDDEFEKIRKAVGLL